MYEKKLEEARCHVERKFNFLDGKWNIMILCAMSDRDEIRFSELKTRLPNISDMTLSNALKALISEDMIKRTAYNEIPPRVDYGLTEKGKSFIPVIKNMCTWSCGYEEKEEADKYCWRANQ